MSKYRSLTPFAQNAFDVDAFKRNFAIKVIAINGKHIEADMIGADVGIANKFRRILIAEVPTIAVTKVFVTSNTSIIQDEVLAHRLGMIPILADSSLFDYKSSDEEATDQNTVIFRLRTKCAKNATDANCNVYSGNFEWIPQGNQAELFRDQPIRPVDSDILIAKLRPGQELDLQMYCEKEVGKSHTKWSPVSTVAYRTVDDTSGRPSGSKHFVFSIETTGVLSPQILFREAISILMQELTSNKES
jgi:DNA-directed RNA polymerase I and III subunit RPAC1